MKKNRYLPIPKCEIELYTSEDYDTVIERIGKYSTDIMTAKKRQYNISEYLFIMELTEKGFVLIPEQSNHYGKNNGAMPHLIGTYIEGNEKNTIEISACSDMLIPMSIFILFCSILCVIVGKCLSGIMIFLIANAIMQIVFWLPCRKAIAELERIIGKT